MLFHAIPVSEASVRWGKIVKLLLSVVGGEADTDAPRVKKTPVKKAVSHKRQAIDIETAPVVKNKRTTKEEEAEVDLEDDLEVDEPVAGGSTAEHPVEKATTGVQEPVPESVEQPIVVPVVASPQGTVVEETVVDAKETQGPTEERHWFDLPYDDLIAKWDAERQVVTASDTDEEIETESAVEEDLEMSDGEQGVDKQVDELIDADEKMSLEDILMTIPVDVPLPSVGIEFTKITMGKEIKIPGVDEKTQYLASLPKISVDNKGKTILVEKGPMKGNPAKEHYFLICADIDLLVHLRARVIEVVDQFFHSFSFKKLATINIEEFSKKEQFLESWKNNFVPGKGSLAIDLKVIDMLSNLHLFVLEELREQALADGLKWTRTCSSKIVEGSPRDRGAIIARTNTNTPSTCWLRTMIRVDGVWVFEPLCDQWVKIPRPVVCTEVSRQCSFVDFFPVVNKNEEQVEEEEQDQFWGWVPVVGFQLLGYPDASYSNPDESYSESVFVIESVANYSDSVASYSPVVGIESVASYSNVELPDVGYSVFITRRWL
ncbi:hypothetical protein F511_12938 [Dorcoceras hygrometricum]|uniref:Uncharacterized protein n=1 Tax=Dorcoceras hygrometricum TaxID=472368 RepID=A0A2Z7CZ11_9LAMI|nr:hypothetical protein F511_12938 [Dorcoceras hygrometricum]